MPFCRYELGPFSSSFMLWPVTTGGTIKCHKKHLNEVFITWRHLHFSLKCPKIEQFHFSVSFLVLKSITWFYLEMSHFFYFRKPWNVPFFHLILKMGISKIPNWKWGISRKKHVTKKSPKIQSIDFGAFRRKMLMPSHVWSHDQILVRVHFGAFHGTSRT